MFNFNKAEKNVRLKKCPTLILSFDIEFFYCLWGQNAKKKTLLSIPFASCLTIIWM